MAAMTVAGWFVSPVIEKLIDSCFEYLKDQISCQPGMKKVLERLEVNHPKIQSVVNHATEAQIGDPALNKWLWQLRDAIDEADDLLDEIEYMKYKDQVAKNTKETKVQFATTSTLFETVLNLGEIGVRFLMNDSILNRLEEVVHNLDKVSADFVTFVPLVNNAKEELRREQLDMLENREEGSLPKNDLIGRGEDKESVMRWLRQTSNEEHPTHITSTALYNNVSILSIVGDGGMGKTTLLQHVYEDETTKEFDLKMWVCVSTDFDVKRVIINMLESFQNKKPKVESLNALQHGLKSAVSSKKFLLVLDDVWEEEDKSKWEKVLAPLASGSLGSKILVSTRMDSAAAMIAKVIKKKKKTLILKGLEEDECLQLLNTHAFAGEENPDDHKKLRSITVEIAKKLSGSPLAAKVIGGALNSSLDERHWITILKSDFRNAEFGQNGILPILRLSYMFIPRHLQNCFAFCSIFPQDHKFDKDDLVRMWIALGFIPSSANKEETVEDIGGSIQELEHMNELRQLGIKLLQNVKVAEQACKAKICDKRNLTDLSLEWDNNHVGKVFVPGDDRRWYWESGTLRNIVDPEVDERVLENLKPHSSLKELRIHAFMGVRSPIWLKNADLLSNLEFIQLDTCLEWHTLPPFGKLPFLKSLYLIKMPKAKSIDYNYHRNEKDCVFPFLELLHIQKLDALEDWFDATITDDCLFPCLTELSLIDCPNLKELPCLPPKLKSLQISNIGWKTLSCRHISKSIPIENLSIHDCPNITLKNYLFAAPRSLAIDLISLGGHQEVGTTENCRLTLDFLHIRDPSMLLKEPLRSIASLKELVIFDNNSLFDGSLLSLESLSSLKRITIYGDQFHVLPNFPASLEFLELRSLISLQCLPSSLSTLSSLKSLKINGAPLLQQLPDLPSSLEYLSIYGCHEELKNRYNKISGFDRDKLAHIPDVNIR